MKTSARVPDPRLAAKSSSGPAIYPRIPVAAPVLDGRETEYVLECLSTSWISSAGRFIVEFERAFSDFCGVKHAVATNNGTTALHLALVAMDLKPGDEVIVPTLTYIASANVVRYCGATPVFVDNDVRTFNMDVNEVAAKITSRTRGIIPVHLYGHPVDLDPLLELARQHDVFLLEDAAEAVGARYKGRRIGAHGTCAAFSFFGNKIITTGEGGMVTTNDDELASRLRLFRGQGMDLQRRYWFPVIGYNYRMTNIAAALGLAQLERVNLHMEKRKTVADGYNRRLSALADYIQLPTAEVWAEHAYWMYTILLRDRVLKQRDEVMRELEEVGIETRPVFYPMHVLPPYRDVARGAFPRAELCSSRGINLPTHGRLTEQDMDRVASALAASVSAS
jgi:perosamine synthetase